MNVSRTLTFQWTTAAVVFSVLMVIATGVFAFIAWRRSGYRATIGALESLRMIIVIVAALLFNQPEWIEEFHPDEKSQLAVLWDSTKSMETRDVIRSNAAGTIPPGPTSTASGSEQPSANGRTLISRREAIADLATQSAWSSLTRKNTEVVLEPIVESGAAGGTDLAAALIAATEKHKNLRAIVLMSEGDWNVGQPPAAAAAVLRQKNIPAFVVPVGSKTRLPDVELVSVDVPTFGIAGKSVRIPFTI